MLKSRAEYEAAINEIRTLEFELQKHAAELIASGLSTDHVELATSLQSSKVTSLRREVLRWQALQQGNLIEGLADLTLGDRLTALRIFRDIPQHELASRIGAHQAQVSKWEKTGYIGISHEKYLQIISALGFSLIEIICEGDYADNVTTILQDQSRNDNGVLTPYPLVILEDGEGR